MTVNQNDPCYRRWLELGAPRHDFPGLRQLADESMFLSLTCTSTLLPILFDFAVDDETAERAYFNPWASDVERGWAYAFLSLSILDRASLLAAVEQFWNPLWPNRIAAQKSANVRLG